MSGKPDSWRDVAFALASRLSWSACEEHSHKDPETGGCPFCADVLAYRRFVTKHGSDPWAVPAGPSVSVFDLRHQDTKVLPDLDPTTPPTETTS